MSEALSTASVLLSCNAEPGHTRGKAYVEAVLAAEQASSGSNLSDALEAWGKVVSLFPDDPLACKRASQFAFMLAKPQEMLELTKQSFAVEGEGKTPPPIVGGIHAFALEQNGLFACAELVGKQAVCGPGGDKLDIWAIHAVCSYGSRTLA